MSFISWDIHGHPGMSAILHTTAESQANVQYVSFISWDIPGHPGMSAILHTTAESQAYVRVLYILGYPWTSWDVSYSSQPRHRLMYVSFISWDIPRYPGMSAIIHTTAEFQAYVRILYILGFPKISWGVSHHPHYSWIAGLPDLSAPGYPRTSWDVSHPSHYNGVPGLSVLSVPEYPRACWDVSHSPHYSWVPGLDNIKVII